MRRLTDKDKYLDKEKTKINTALLDVDAGLRLTGSFFVLAHCWGHIPDKFVSFLIFDKYLYRVFRTSCASSFMKAVHGLHPTGQPVAVQIRSRRI